MESGTILLVLAMAAITAGHGGGSHYSGSHYSGSSHLSSSSGHHSSNFHGRSSTFGSSTHGYYASGSHHDATSHSHAAVGVERDSHGRIKRSEEAKREFMRQTGYPHGRPGYVIDHIIPLKRGGADSPSNMQWQTIAEAKAKDKWE
jgi:hypothetical protein